MWLFLLLLTERFRCISPKHLQMEKPNTVLCYMQWFTKAGFTDVKITRIGPKWYRGVRRHGLIMGCSVTGRKIEVVPNFIL